MSRYDQFINRLQEYAQLPCLRCDGRTYNYAELLAAIDRWQLRLAEFNAAPGMVVGLHADYSLESVAALLALLSRRNIAALIPAGGDHASYLRDACVDGLLTIGTDASVDYQRHTRHGTHELLRQLVAANDAGLVIFTSGSTGRPKAALHSIERFLSKFQRPGRRFTTLGFLLFDHIAGIDTLFYSLASGGCLAVTRKRDPETICQLIEEAAVEVLPASPSFLRLLCLAGGSVAGALGSLKIITYGSEPMDPATLQLLNARFPRLQISQKYGTTETGAPRAESRGKDSLWLRFKSDSVEAKVLDDVLWLRSEGTILGYLNAESPVDRDGWYCTGDLVDVDGEWFRFRGRASEVINVGGEKVAPAEVEQAILQLDVVRSVIVAGQANALMGQIVTANVVLDRDMDQKQAARLIREQCRRQLAAYKVPVKIHFVAAEPTSNRRKAPRHPGQQ